MFDSNNGCSVALSNRPLSTIVGEVLATDWKHFSIQKKGGKALGSVETVVLTNECTSPWGCVSLTYRMSTEKRFDQLLVSQYEIK